MLYVVAVFPPLRQINLHTAPKHNYWDDWIIQNRVETQGQRYGRVDFTRLVCPLRRAL